jgi:hypothetical protein
LRWRLGILWKNGKSVNAKESKVWDILSGIFEKLKWLSAALLTGRIEIAHWN